MPFPWMAVAMGAQALGSAFGAANQNKMNNRQLDEQRRQFDLQQRQQQQQFSAQQGQSDRQFGQQSNLSRANQLDQRSVGAADMQRRLSMAPLTDQAMSFMQARAGAAPAAFQARDFTRGAMPGAGAAQGGMGSTLNATRTAMQNYRPGMGGLDTSALRESVARLRSQQDIPGMYGAPAGGVDTPPPPPPPAYGGGGGGGGGGGATELDEQQRALMARFTPYLL